MQDNRPVDDKRQTREARAQQAREHQRLHEERAKIGHEEQETFLALYGSGETVTVQPGQMAITARICYDNSDTMTDYFDSHASLSPRFALLIVRKQAETERLARRAIEAYALLASQEFKWHTEKYSMGHGNYLESRGFELPSCLSGIRKYYRGGQVNHGHWEIEFEQTYGKAFQIPAIKSYGGKPAEPGSPEYEALRKRIARLERQGTAPEQTLVADARHC